MYNMQCKNLVYMHSTYVQDAFRNRSQSIEKIHLRKGHFLSSLRNAIFYQQINILQNVKETRCPKKLSLQIFL